MKKTLACICILFGVLGVRADVRTNYVYVVSNIFINVYTENVVTQKVKSSHTDFYYTNYVSVVTNVYQTTFRTNVSVNVDVSQSYVNAAANAASNALSFASESAASATAAGSSASSASASADRAAASAASASSAASDGLQRINERINWFDLHSGETITQNNYYWQTNVYYAIDYSARARIGTNEEQIANLNSLVSSAQARIGTNEERISNFRVEFLNMFESFSNWVQSVISENRPAEKRAKEYWYTVYVQPYNVGTLMVSLENIDERSPTDLGQSFFYEYATSWVEDGTTARPYVSRRHKSIPNVSSYDPYAEINLTINGEVVSFVSYETGPDQYTFFTNSIERTYSNGRRCSITFDHIVYDE